MELAAQNNKNNNDTNPEEGRLSKAELKRLPIFRKGDDPESFITLFERACEDFDMRGLECMIVASW